MRELSDCALSAYTASDTCPLLAALSEYSIQRGGSGKKTAVEKLRALGPCMRAGFRLAICAEELTKGVRVKFYREK